MRLHILLTVLVSVLLAACGECAKPAPRGPEAYAGGDPIPSRATTIDFPWIGKQSVMCVGDAFERQVAFVDFSAAVDAFEVGVATLDADGNGSARFVIPVAALRTGHADRDNKLLGPVWLDGDTHPKIVLETTRLERVLPTVWLAEGTWTMRGVSKPVRFYANLRYVPEMRNVGTDVVRLEGSFDIQLADYGVGGAFVGTPAVAATWTVEVVVLGTMK